MKLLPTPVGPVMRQFKCSRNQVSALRGLVYPTVGASGGVFGVLLAYALMFPSRAIMPVNAAVAVYQKTR